MSKFKSMSIAHALADNEARKSVGLSPERAFGLAVGMDPLFDADRDGEKAARRARYNRKRGHRALKGL